MTADTIFALSSGSPPAAVAVIRISGPRADSALQALSVSLPEARRATLAELRFDAELLDNALVVRFPGPRSATGEDVVELHLHGGRAVVSAVKAVLARMDGLRAAEPGEFTRRAFDNGRIDLTEAEGLADLLEAETETQRRSALALAGGALGRQAAAWKRRLLDLAAEVEAALDFSDEDDVTPLSRDFPSRLEALRGELQAWLARPPAERLKDGIRVVVLGPPNAGKSSLVNALAQRDAAITSAVPGTTRDLIEVPVAIGGLPFLLVDTAGLREAVGEIEAIGIERAQASAAAADLLLWLGPPADAPAGSIAIRPKADLGGSSGDSELAVSALTGQGMDALVRTLLARAAALLPAAGEVALNARHRAALGDASGDLGEARSAADLLLIAEALRRARAALDAVTGDAGVEDMLDALFGRFCIGK
ncbi:MAG: tRNA modification GTPase [Sphingomonadales bacterium]|nr:tRNA modification GTPase [Sphingomonadales bacterium]